MRPSWLSAWLASAVIGWSSSASAEALAFEWSAPADCPSAHDVRARTSDLVRARQRTASEVHASGRVKRKGAGWHLLLTIDVNGHRATRSLSAERCATLAEAAAWLIAVAIDPQLESAPAPASEPEPEPSAASSETPPSQASSSSASDELTELTWRVGVYTGVFAGGLAGPNASLGARVGFELGGWAAELSLAHHFERVMELAAPSGGASEFSAQELALGGCYAWGNTLRFGPCAVLSALRVEGDVVRITQPRGDSALSSTAGLSIAFAYRLLERWELFADGGLWVPLSKRPRFEVEAVGSVGEGAALGGRVRIGVGLRLP